jgi:hypothetical protein
MPHTGIDARRPSSYALNSTGSTTLAHERQAKKMFRTSFRLAGLLFLAGAFAAMIVDGTRSISAGAPALMPLQQFLMIVAPDIVPKIHASIAAHAPSLWDPAALTVLKAPVWAATGLTGILLFLLTRPPQPKIGYARR